MVNRYFDPKPFEGQLYAPPVKFIEEALQGAQKQYDANYLASEQLKNKYINAWDADRARANQIQNEISTQVDEVVKKYNGDYSQATKELLGLTSKLNKMWAPGGEVATIEGNFKAVQEAMKENKERLAKGEVTADQVNAQYNYYKTNYKGVKQDPNTGLYNTLTIDPLSKYVDHAKIYEDVLKGITPKTTQRMVPAGKDGAGYIVYEKREVQYKDPNEVRSALEANLFNNDAFKGYVQQKAKYEGKDPNVVMNTLVDEYITNSIPARTGTMVDKQELSFQTDLIAQDQRALSRGLALQRAQLANKIAFDQYKRKADQEEMGTDGTDLALLAEGDSAGSPYRPITNPTYSPDGGMFSRRVPLPVDKILQGNSGFDGYKINKPLLKSIKDANPNMPDSDMWLIYNNSVKNFDNAGAGIYYNPYRTSAAQKEDAARIIPSLQTGNVPVYKIDSRTGVTTEITSAAEKMRLGQAWKKDKQPRALGKSSASSGKVPFGTVMASPDDSPNEYYVIGDNTVAISKLQKDYLDPAFRFISDPGAEVGDPFNLLKVENGNIVQEVIMGAKGYDYNSTVKAGVGNIRYYSAVKTPDGKWKPDMTKLHTTNGRPSEPIDIERLLLPASEVAKTFPINKMKPSAEENTLYENP